MEIEAGYASLDEAKGTLTIQKAGHKVEGNDSDVVIRNAPESPSSKGPKSKGLKKNNSAVVHLTHSDVASNARNKSISLKRDNSSSSRLEYSVALMEKTEKEETARRWKICGIATAAVVVLAGGVIALLIFQFHVIKI
jgi:hypothetical protein